MKTLSISTVDAIIQKEGPLWYAHEDIWHIIDSLFVRPGSLDEGEEAYRQEFLAYIQGKLEGDLLPLGNVPALTFDRVRYQTSTGFHFPITKVVIHHTGEHLTVPKLNALDLLRRYCPLFMNVDGFLGNDGKRQGISSGHYRMMNFKTRQVFATCHWLINDELPPIRTLEDVHLGLHTDSLMANSDSIGILINRDLTKQVPSRKAIDSINWVIRYIKERHPQLSEILGHNEVDGQASETCPGNTWREWKDQLVIPR